MDKKSNFMANLMKAKQTMDIVESGNYKVDHSQVNAMISGGDTQLLESLPENAIPNRGNSITRPVGTATESQIVNSKLPESVKKIMMEQPIPKMEMGSGGGPTFSIDDVRAMVQKSPQAPQQQTQPTSVNYTQVPQQQINETVVTNSKGQMLITLTEEELDKKIQEGVAKYMTEQFAKNLRKETIKRTMQTLINEGKLKVRTKSSK
jgi:hypothetical protein